MGRHDPPGTLRENFVTATARPLPATPAEERIRAVDCVRRNARDGADLALLLDALDLADVAAGAS